VYASCQFFHTFAVLQVEGVSVRFDASLKRRKAEGKKGKCAYLSQLPLTIRFPSSLTCKAQTLASWPIRVWLGEGVEVEEGGEEREGRGQA
jgi:hypothetical protein